MSSTSKFGAWFIPSAIVAYTIAILPPSATPMLISHLVQFIQFSEVQAGFIATSSLFALAVGTMCVAGLIGRVKSRTIIVVAAIGAILTNVVSSFVAAFYSLAVLQIFAGLSFGLLYGAANATLAHSEKPDRAFAVAILTVKITAALMLLILPYMAQWLGYATVFWFLAIVVATSFPIMIRLPEHRQSTSKESRTRKSATRKGIAWVEMEVIAITFLFFVVNGAAWSMSSQIGQRIGIPMATIGLLLGTVVTIGILGPLLASILGTRFGRFYPLSVGIGLNALSIFGLAFSQHVNFYFAFLIVFDVTFLFIHPYLLGVASELDRTGKLVVTSSSLGMFGFGVAPALSGLSVQHLGITSLGWFSLMISAAFLLMLFHVLAYMKKSAQIESISYSTFS